MDRDQKFWAIIWFYISVSFCVLCVAGKGCNDSDNKMQESVRNNAINKGCTIRPWGDTFSKVAIECPDAIIRD